MQTCYNGVRVVNGPCLENVMRLDHGAVPMIAAMMRRGMQVDLSHFAKLEKDLTDDMERITEEVRSLTGYYCNLGSGDQVADLLFKKLGLKQARRKLTLSEKRESVEEDVLIAIQHDHPVVPKCLDYKELEKLRGTYVSPMPRLARRTSFGVWRMFPKLGHTRVPSGRLNCKDPNLLAMPTRTERGKDIRRGFITDPGWKIVSVDESQIEMRMAAYRSKDTGLVNIYLNREDIYSDFAIAAFKLKDDRYKDDKGKWQYPSVHPMDHRYPAKTCVLASLYEVSAPGLLEQMPVICANCHLEATKHTCFKFKALWTEGMCQDLINAFYVRYGGLLKRRKADYAVVRRYAYQWDMWGRILHCAAVRSVHEWVVAAALREANNFPYQAGAQGTVKLTMAQVEDDRNDYTYTDVVHPLLQVHDELLFECREDVAEEWGQHVAMRFENCVRLDEVPIKAGVAMADNWGDLEK